MAKWLLFIGLITFNSLQAQIRDTLEVDLDADKRMDIVILDRSNFKIVCKLSSQSYQAVNSLELDLEQAEVNIRSLQNGFSYSVPSMRSGYHADFKYDKTARKMRLVTMDRYEFGPANNDGSGESKVNLLTNSYIGDWNYYDDSLSKLIKIPTIKKNMVFPATYLDNFNEQIIYNYLDLCSQSYEQAKRRLTGKGYVPKVNVYWKNFYPFKDKRYVVSIKKNEDNAISTMYLLDQKSTNKKVILKESLVINQSDDFVRYEDFNGDGVKDFLVFSTTGARGSNEFYYLYLLNDENKKMIRIPGFNEIVNPIYNPEHKVVISYGFSGQNSYTIYKIVDYKLLQIGESFIDDFDSDPALLSRKINKLLSAKPVKK